MTEDTPRVVICQGPPWCLLQHDETPESQETMLYCRMCRVEQYDLKTGEWIVIQDMKAN